MPSDDKSIVRIYFNGLFLFEMDNMQKVCEAKICTSAENHRLHIDTVTKNKNMRYPTDPHQFISGAELAEDFHPLKFIIESPGNLPSQKLSAGAGYDSILNMREIYSSVDVKPANYGASFFISNGVVDCDELNQGCWQVLYDQLKNQKFSIGEAEWLKIIKSDYKAAVLSETPQRFARNVMITIWLEQNQTLSLYSKGGSNQIMTIAGTPKQNCDIFIYYEDDRAPTCLEDCKGIGHHSEAVKPPNEPLWAFFSPCEPKDGGETASGCCEPVRIN